MIFFLIFQSGKLRHKEIKQLAQQEQSTAWILT